MTDGMERNRVEKAGLVPESTERTLYEVLDRRRVLALILAALTPLPAQAQQEARKVPRIALIRPGSPPDPPVDTRTMR